MPEVESLKTSTGSSPKAQDILEEPTRQVSLNHHHVPRRRLSRSTPKVDPERDEEADSVDEPALERDLSVEDDRSIHLALERSRTRTETSSVVRRREKLSKKEAGLLRWATYSLLVFATLWGVLARLGLEWIGGWAQGEVFAVVWPQIVGCIVLGFVVDRKKGLERSYVPMFVALGTGFCGSTTTFSSWMYGVFVAFANLESNSTNRFQGFFSGVAVTAVTLGMSNTALRIGVHISSFLPRQPPTSLQHHPKSSSSRPLSQHMRHLISLLIGPLFWLGAILLLALGPHSWRHRATFALVLGPPGTLLRYELSRQLNPISTTFPVGTYVANTFAVLLFAITALLQRRQPGTMGALGCAALQGVQDGFCGSLSTVSTFVVELRNLRTRDSWRYAGVSWLTGQAVFVLVLGSWVWSGDRGAVC